jgi:hypothetical protein
VTDPGVSHVPADGAAGTVGEAMPTDGAAGPSGEAMPADGGEPDGTPRTRDYLRGVITVVGVLVLIVVAIWVAVAVAGVDCGCTTRAPASLAP